MGPLYIETHSITLYIEILYEHVYWDILYKNVYLDTLEVVSILLYGCTDWTLTERLKKKLDGNYTSPGGKTPQSTNYTATCLLSRKLYKLDEPDTQYTAREARTSS